MSRRMTHEQDAAMRAATELIYAERYRQHAENGEQDIPLTKWPCDFHLDPATSARYSNSKDEERGALSFYGLAVRELHEACSKVDLDRQIEEWTQFAAVAHQGLEALMRRKAVAE